MTVPLVSEKRTVTVSTVLLDGDASPVKNRCERDQVIAAACEQDASPSHHDLHK
jgi:hypothetical protein